MSCISIAVWAAFCLLVGAASEAVLINTGTGDDNTAPPSDDPGFANVGTRGGSTAVYLGDGWVLTAAHVPGGNVVFGKESFPWIPSSNTRLRNTVESGLDEFSDLRMFQLESWPDLPPLRLGRRPHQATDKVVMIGNGKDRETTPTGWEIEGSGTSSAWVETTPAGTPGDRNGYKWLSTNEVRWGENAIVRTGRSNDDVFVVVNSGFGDTVSVYTNFSHLEGELEGQAVTNDSGGAFFHHDGEQWLLTGIIHAAGVFGGQPRSTTVYGNKTYAAALSEYHGEIEYRLMSTRVDMNVDGAVDAADAAILFEDWGSSPGSVADLNRDGLVDALDAASLAQFWEMPTVEAASSGLAADQLDLPVELPRVTEAQPFVPQQVLVPEPTCGPAGLAFLTCLFGCIARSRKT